MAKKCEWHFTNSKKLLAIEKALFPSRAFLIESLDYAILSINLPAIQQHIKPMQFGQSETKLLLPSNNQIEQIKTLGIHGKHFFKFRICIRFDHIKSVVGYGFYRWSCVKEIYRNK